MKKTLYIIFLLFAIGCSPKSDFYVYKSPKPVFETSEYTVEQIIEGPNRSVPKAVVLSTDKEYSEDKLIEIKNQVLKKKLTKSNIISAPFIFRNSKKVYGVLFDYYTQKIRKDEFVGIDSIKHYGNIYVEKINTKNLEVIGIFADGGDYTISGYKVFGVLVKNRENGDLILHRYNGRYNYKVTLINNKLMINTNDLDKEPFYELELQIQESGDLVLYSHNYNNASHYYFKIE